MEKDQKGFGILEVLLSIVLLGVIGGAGWYVIKARANDTYSSSTKRTSETSQTTDQENSAYLTYDKNPNFIIAYPKDWSVKTDNEDTNNQYIFFSTANFTSSGKVYSDSYAVSQGSQFYVYITTDGLPTTINEMLANLKDGINNAASLYVAKGISFQEPKILKTVSGIDYVSFTGHSSFMTPINNSSNALFLKKKYGVTLGYTYPNRTDIMADPAYAKEFTHFVESLNFK